MTVPALDDHHDLLIRSGFTSTEGTRDRFTYDREDMLADAIEAWRVNPIARRIVALTSQYVVGAGIQITSRHEPTSAFLHDWQEHRLNRLQTRAFEWCDELTRTGNLCIVLTTDAAGMSYLRAVPVTDLEDIETKPNDVEQPVRFILKPVLLPSPASGGGTGGGGQEPVSYPAYDEATDAPDESGAFPAVMLHYAINRPVGAKWGESDLAPLLLWLSRYANWLQDRARLNKYRQAFMYDVQGQFASEADRLARQAEINANPPTPGAILVHNATEIWTVLSPKLDSSDANTDGLALKKMIAAGAGVPLHFLAEPESSTRTTAEAAGGPTFRHYQQRQVFFLWLLRDLARIVIHRRALVDRHVSIKADIVAQAPDISGRDNAALAVAATQIVSAFAQLHDRGLIPDDEFVRLAYAFAGETVDVDEILARAPRTPQAPLPSPASGGGAGGGGQPNQPKPYNQNADGDVTEKGATMADVADLVTAENTHLREWLHAELSTGGPCGRPGPDGRPDPSVNPDPDPAPAPAPMPLPIQNTITLDLTPIATAVGAAITDSHKLAAETAAASLQATADAAAVSQATIVDVLTRLADRQPPAPIVNVTPQINVPAQTLPAPVVNVTPQINVPAQIPPTVKVSVEIPPRTKHIIRDDEGRMTDITED